MSPHTGKRKFATFHRHSPRAVKTMFVHAACPHDLPKLPSLSTTMMTYDHQPTTLSISDPPDHARGLRGRSGLREAHCAPVRAAPLRTMDQGLRLSSMKTRSTNFMCLFDLCVL